MTTPAPIALVTGAGRGIGRAVALALADAGMRVAVTARTASEIEETALLVADSGGHALTLRCDVTSYGDCEQVLDEVVRHWDAPPTVLVNNAGGGDVARRLVQSDPAEWTATLHQNLVGTYHVCRAVAPAMAGAGGGRIVNIGSGSGYRPLVGTSAYGTAKAAVAHLTRVLAAELWRDEIEVNEVVPGPVATRLTEDFFTLGETPRLVPSERVKEPSEVADLVRWLVTRPPGGPTGQLFSLARRPL